MPKKQFKLTKKNYYDPLRPHLSYTQLKTYLKSPVLYKLRYVDKTNKFHGSDSVKFGKLFDALLTDPVESSKFHVGVCRKDMSEDEKQYTVTENTYKEAESLAAYVQEQPFWQSSKETQVVLQGRLHNTDVCGLADAIIVTPQGPAIIDLKTTNESRMKSDKAWYYHVLDYGYHIQAGLYRKLYLQQHGEVVDFYHAVCCVDADNMPHVKLYKFPDELCKAGLDLADIAINGIRNNVFVEDSVDWNQTKMLSNENQYGDHLQEVFE
jgi:hypothetical protein